MLALAIVSSHDVGAVSKVRLAGAETAKDLCRVLQIMIIADTALDARFL